MNRISQIIRNHVEAFSPPPPHSAKELASQFKNFNSSEAQRVRAQIGSMPEDEKAILSKSLVDLVTGKVGAKNWQKTNALWLLQYFPLSAESSELLLEKATQLNFGKGPDLVWGCISGAYIGMFFGTNLVTSLGPEIVPLSALVGASLSGGTATLLRGKIRTDNEAIDEDRKLAIHIINNVYGGEKGFALEMVKLIKDGALTAPSASELMTTLKAAQLEGDPAVLQLCDDIYEAAAQIGCTEVVTELRQINGEAASLQKARNTEAAELAAIRIERPTQEVQRVGRRPPN